MYCEISEKCFNRLVSTYTDCLAHSVENKELCRKTYYKTHDSLLMRIDNFASYCTQYYIQDINS